MPIDGFLVVVTVVVTSAPLSQTIDVDVVVNAFWSSTIFCRSLRILSRLTNGKTVYSGDKSSMEL
jgi:hypothetical protein